MVPCTQMNVRILERNPRIFFAFFKITYYRHFQFLDNYKVSTLVNFLVPTLNLSCSYATFILLQRWCPLRTLHWRFTSVGRRSSGYCTPIHLDFLGYLFSAFREKISKKMWEIIWAFIKKTCCNIFRQLKRTRQTPFRTNLGLGPNSSVDFQFFLDMISIS